MTATDFLTDRKLRDECIPHTEVLDKIKILHCIPATQCFTMKQMAEYYEVPLKTIESCYRTHYAEIEMDGVTVLTPKIYKEILNPCGSSVKNFVQHNGKMEIFVDENTSIIIPNRGIKIFPKRAFLRTGLLLTQSQVAEQVRTLAVDMLMSRESVTVSSNANDLEVAVYLNIHSENYEDAIKSFNAFVKYKDTLILQKDAEIAQLKEQIQALEQLQLTTESKPQNKKTKGYSVMQVEEMKEKFNKIVRAIAIIRKVYFGVVYNGIYKILEKDYSIFLTERRDNDPREKRLVAKERKGKRVVHMKKIDFLKNDEWGYLRKCVDKYIKKCGIDGEELISTIQAAYKREYEEIEND